MNEAKPVRLKRALNLPLLVLYGVGNILGAGIYVLVGEVAAVSGYLAPAAFMLAALIATLTGFAYVELSARFPLSAGEAVYVYKGFRRRWLSTLVGLLVCSSGIISSATLARGFVGYAQLFLNIPTEAIILALVLLLTLVAIIGIVESVGMAALFTLLEAAGLLVIVWVSAESYTHLPERMPQLLPDFSSAAWLAVFAGAFLSFFAFIGFEDMVNVAEEVKQPERTLPKAILLALGVCTVLYAAISLAAVLQVEPANLAGSGAPLALIYEAATGQPATFIGALGMVAIVNGILIQLIMVSRIIYGMARNNWIPAFLARVNSRTHTPVISTLVVATIILGLALFFPLLSLAKATSLLVLGVFTLVNLALIAVKLRQTEPSGVVEIPIIVPIAGAIASASLAAVSLVL